FIGVYNLQSFDLQCSSHSMCCQAEVGIRDFHVTGVQTCALPISLKLERGEGTLGMLLTDDDLYGRLEAGAAQLETALRELNRMDGTLGRLIRDPALYEQLDRAIARVDSVGALLLHGGGALGQLLRSDSLYRHLLATVGRADTALMGLSGML